MAELRGRSKYSKWQQKIDFPLSKTVKLLNQIKGYAINDVTLLFKISVTGVHIVIIRPWRKRNYPRHCVHSAREKYLSDTKRSKLKYQRAPKHTFRVPSKAPRPELQKFRPPGHPGAYILLSWCLIFVGPQHETCFMSPNSRLLLWGGS